VRRVDAPHVAAVGAQACSGSIRWGIVDRLVHDGGDVRYVLVAAGGALGAIARYRITDMIQGRQYVAARPVNE